MKKILGILMIIAFVACQEDSAKADFSGTIAGVKDSTQIFVSALGKNNRLVPVDTAIVKNESFTLELPDSKTQSIHSLRVENIRGNVLFINENEPLTFTIYKDSIRASVVTGGKNNALLSDYFDHLKAFGKKTNNIMNQFRNPANRGKPKKIKELRKQQQALADKNAAYLKDLVKNNPNSLVSVMALTNLIQIESPSPELKKLYDNLAPEIQKSKAGKQIHKMFKTASATAIGSKAPLFSGPTPTGETLALKDVLGKVTLIDFWASWCKPCRKENPNIVRIYKKYHDKGLNIVGVSLDKNKEKWVQAIETDGLVWNHVSNLKFWQGPIARKYNIRTIPAAFLLDENGVIVAKDLRGEELEEKVAELLAE